MTLNAENRLAVELVRMVNDESLTLDAPYQRGSVWTTDQKVGLCKSLIMRIPVPAVVINDRTSPEWAKRNGYVEAGEPFVAVVDGKQRLEAIRDWLGGRLPLPASWFEEQDIERTQTADDGTEWVTYDDLTHVGKRRTENRFALPVARGSVDSLEEEARLYLLLNGAGTAQTDADMDNAARVADGG